MNGIFYALDYHGSLMSGTPQGLLFPHFFHHQYFFPAIYLIIPLENNYSLMKAKTIPLISLLAATIFIFTSARKPVLQKPVPAIKHYLYVAVPGIRDYLGYGGHGILVFDIDDHHRFVKRITTKGFHPDNTPSNVKGIAVSIALNSIFISTIESLQRIDLATDKLIWEKKFEGGCDRMAISPDGKTMYLPSFENTFWNVVDCATGDIIKKITVNKKAHNTIYGPSGQHVYLDDIASPWLYVADAKKHELVNKIGPFANFVRPFTINGKETLAYVTVDSLLGFEVGDLITGKKLAHIEVQGWTPGPVRRHGDPSHGIALTPDEKEIWLADGHNMRLHVFSNTASYQQLTTIPLQDMPGWITFSIDGKYVYPSSGEVIDTKTRKIITTLQDEFHNNAASEKMLEIDITGNKVVKAGNQFGIGGVR
jgi:DNA-binding beta-propeller fold protein YncE